MVNSLADYYSESVGADFTPALAILPVQGWRAAATAARAAPVRSGSLNVACLLALRAGRDIEIDALTFGQGLETVGLNRRKMSEEIFTTIIRRNEAKTLGIVKPLHATCCHILNLLKFTGHGP